MPRPADRRTKIELLRAAEAVFSEHGLASAKVEDITARAGVSKGAFYLHFESKEDCWRQIVEAFMAKLAACVEPTLNDMPESGPVPVTLTERIRKWHEHDLNVLEFCWNNRAFMRTMLEGGGGSHYAYLIDEMAERTAKVVEAWVRYGSEVGIYRRNVDPSVVAALISGAYDRMVRELIKLQKRPEIAAWSRQAIDLMTCGLLTEDARLILDREVKNGGLFGDEPKHSAGSSTGTNEVGRDSALAGRSIRRAGKGITT